VHRFPWKGGLLLAFLLCTGSLASRVHYKELSEVLTSERPVVEACVVRSEVEILPNELQVRVEVEDVKSIYLEPPSGRVWTHSFSTMLDRTGSDGSKVRVSPIRDGSGIEQNLEVQKRYLFVLEPGGERLVRVMPLSQETEVRRILGIEK
jgi:hypothetical protein